MWPFSKKKDNQPRIFGMRTDEALYRPEPTPLPDQLFDGKALNIKQYDIGPYHLFKDDTITPVVEWGSERWEGEPIPAEKLESSVVDSMTTFTFKDALGYVNGFCLTIGKRKE